MALGLTMKNRTSLLFFLACLGVTSLFLSMSANQRRNIHTIVEETQIQIKNLKKNFEDPRHLYVDEKYLELLGLTSDWSRLSLWPSSPWHRTHNASVPVIVTAVQNGHAGEAVHFIRNAQHFFPNLTIVLHDMGLSRHELELVEKYCNISLCLMQKFDSRQYPGHVSNLRNHAYRPLIIQHTLKLAGCVLWMSVDQRFTHSFLGAYIMAANSTGIQAWITDDQIPTSAMTHPKMFERFGISNVEDYNFQHMVDLKALLIFNKPAIHQKIIKPWVKCALLDDCLEPIGAQSSGCRLDKKPQFRYSGCHSYDVSSLNVVLGQAFNFEESKYVSEHRFFVQMSEEMESNDDLEFVGNFTLFSEAMHNNYEKEDEEEMEEEDLN